LKNQEGSEVEVKLSGDSNKRDIATAMCGLANTIGGKIIIGFIEKKYFNKKFPVKDMTDYRIISKEFVLIGLSNIDDFRKDLSSYIKGNTNLNDKNIDDLYKPKIFHINNKNIMCLEVNSFFKDFRKLITLDGKVYKRYDNQTVEMKTEEIISIFNKT
jgi:predicted HTH transcriptional regulator